MEKKLPLTAIFLESIAVALGSFLFVRGTTGFVAIIILSAFLVILLTFILQKKIPSVAMGYLITLGLSYGSMGDNLSSQVIFSIVIFVIFVEIVKFIPDLLVSRSKVGTTSPLLNATLAFIGMNIGIVYRVNTCSSLVSDTGWNYFAYTYLPICPLSFGTLAQSSSIGIVLKIVFEFLAWPAISGLIFASLSETLRNASSSSFIGAWFVNFWKTTFVSSVLSFTCFCLLTVLTIPQVVPSTTWEFLDRSLKTFTSREPTLFIWSFVIFVLMIYSLIFGLAAAWRGKQN